MSGEEKNKKMQESGKLLSTVMNGTGALFILFGLFCMTNTEMAGQFIGLGAQEMGIAAWVFIAAGIADMIVARIFFNKIRAR